MTEPACIESERWAKKLKRWEREHDKAVIGALITLRGYTASDYFEEVSKMGFQPCAIASRSKPMRFIERPPPMGAAYDRARYRLLTLWACAHRNLINAEIIQREAIFVNTRRGPWDTRLRHIGMNWPAARRFRLPSF